MSFPELSKPRESRCIGKDKPFFLLNFRLVGYPECSGLDAKLVKWSRASYWQWCVDLALSAPGSQLVSALETCGASIVSAGAVLCPLPPYPCLFCW